MLAFVATPRQLHIEGEAHLGDKITVKGEKFDFRRPDGSLVGHGAFMVNRVESLTKDDRSANVISTRKPFDERFKGLRLGKSG